MNYELAVQGFVVVNQVVVVVVTFNFVVIFLPSVLLVGGQTIGAGERVEEATPCGWHHRQVFKYGVVADLVLFVENPEWEIWLVVVVIIRGQMPRTVVDIVATGDFVVKDAVRKLVDTGG